MYPEFTVDFVGGPLDGQTLASDKDFEGSKAYWFLVMAGSRVNQQEKMETKFDSLMRWRVPSSTLTEKAKAENWPQAKVDYLMQYHDYDIVSYQEDAGIVLFRAEYRGMSEGKP